MGDGAVGELIIEVLSQGQADFQQRVVLISDLRSAIFGLLGFKWNMMFPIMTSVTTPPLHTTSVSTACLAGCHVVCRPLLIRHSAACKQHANVVVRTTLRSHNREVQFDWWMFWEFASPDLLLLSAVVLVSG